MDLKNVKQEVRHTRKQIASTLRDIVLVRVFSISLQRLVICPPLIPIHILIYSFLDCISVLLYTIPVLQLYYLR